MRGLQPRRANQCTKRSGSSPAFSRVSIASMPIMPRSREQSDYLSSMRAEDILLPTPSGVCSRVGGFHIDPTRQVDRALITHAHSDHARAGHGAVLATRETLDLMRLRSGEK